MNRVPAIALAVAMGAAFTTANAQFTARSASTPKVPSIGSPATSGGFQQGSDDCAAAHTNAGTGDVSGVSFVHQTTGTTGQTEALCYAFATSAVENDVWFDWTATQSGNATLSMCGGTTTDTKVAVWPDNSPASCPASGTSLGCNDDSCGLQSAVTWGVSNGSTYTFQIGSFPGTSPGAGTFSVTQTVPPGCGQYDDGTTENALGLVAGGEMGWMHYFTCLSTIGSVQTAYGTLMFPGSVTNGNNSQIAAYDDTDADPTTGSTRIATTSTVVVNGDTDILNTIPLAASFGGGNQAILATADQVSGEFPGPMDQAVATPEAWVVGSTVGPGTLDTGNLNNNNVPPMNMTGIGFPAAWLLRADATGQPSTGTAVCFGDGSGAPCGCGNEIPATGGGCGNGIGTGAVLTASGSADTTNDTLSLTADLVTAQPGLMFQGNNTINGGAGTTFGDGIRCCGQGVLRLEVLFGMQPEPTTVTITVTVSNHPGQNVATMPGTTFCYQYWYRNPGTSPCGANFNFSNAQNVLWS